MRRRAPLLVVAVVAAVAAAGGGAAGCAAPEQRLIVESRPPGASVWRVDLPADGAAPVAEARAVTLTAGAPLPEGIALGVTPLVARTRARSPYRLYIALEEHAPRAFDIPAVDLDARISVALEPTGALARDDALLGALLDDGPLARADIERRLGGEAAAKEAIARLFARGLVERVATRPDRYDLSVRGLARLEELWGREDVRARALASRRAIWRESREGRR